MAGERSNITLKDIRTFLPQVNCQIAKQRVKKAFQEVDSRKPDELSFDDFASLYHILIHDDNVKIKINHFNITFTLEPIIFSIPFSCSFSKRTF